MIRLKLLALTALILLTAFPLQPARAEAPDIDARAALLMDAENGQILYQKNARMKLYPASTTKILTGIITLEQSNLDETVIVSKNAVKAEGTAIGLQKGEKLPLRSLIYALLLNSANDAAVAIAEHVGGSVAGFARMMNKKAAELGATDSHFVNPHGLTNPRHKTSARDLAIIARYAMQNEKFREIVATRNRKIKRGLPREKKPQVWASNHNRLLAKYEGATGVKTGYTSAAELCIVGSARREGREFIAVVLKSNTPNSLYANAMSLLDYGFEEFRSKTLVRQGKIFTRFSVPHGTTGVLVETRDSLNYNIPVGPEKTVNWSVEPLRDLEAPVNKGDVVGRAVFSYGGRKVGKVDLLAMDSVPRKITHQWWFWLSLALVFFAVFRIWIGLRRRRRRFMFAARKRRYR